MRMWCGEEVSFHVEDILQRQTRFVQGNSGKSTRPLTRVGSPEPNYSSSFSFESPKAVSFTPAFSSRLR